MAQIKVYFAAKTSLPGQSWHRTDPLSYPLAMKPLAFCAYDLRPPFHLSFPFYPAAGRAGRCLDMNDRRQAFTTVPIPSIILLTSWCRPRWAKRGGDGSSRSG